MSTRPSERPPRTALVVFAVLLVSAGALGVAADRVYLMRTGRLTPPGFIPAPAIGRPSQESLDQVFAALQRELDLREDQLPAVRRILEAQVTELEAVRDRVRPLLDTIFETTRDSLDLVLDATQRAKRDALLRRMAPLTDSIGLRRP